MKKEDLIKSLVEKNPDLLKNAEKLIKEYPEECKGLTPEELIYRTDRLEAQTNISGRKLNVDKFKATLPEQYQTLCKLRECWEAVDIKLRNPERKVSEEFPEALKSLQLIDDKGYLNIERSKTANSFVWHFECTPSKNVWQRGKALLKKIKSPTPVQNPDIIENKINPQVQSIAPQAMKDFMDNKVIEK